MDWLKAAGHLATDGEDYSQKDDAFSILIFLPQQQTVTGPGV